MELKVIWSKFAETQLDELFEYNKEKAGVRVANKLVREIIFLSDSLKNSPI